MFFCCAGVKNLMVAEKAALYARVVSSVLCSSIVIVIIISFMCFICCIYCNSRGLVPFFVADKPALLHGSCPVTLSVFRNLIIYSLGELTSLSYKMILDCSIMPGNKMISERFFTSSCLK